MKRNPLPFLISPHSEIDGKLNDEINVQAAREYARRRCNQTLLYCSFALIRFSS